MREYMEKNKSRIFMVGLFAFIIHGAKLSSNIIGIDTEDLIQYQDEFYGGWLNTGRQGLVLLKILLGNLSFNPYLTGILTILCFAAAVSAFLLLWDSVGRDRKTSLWAWIACGLLWISHPIMTEQFYFSLQSAEIGISIFLTAIALYLTCLWENAVIRAKAEGRKGKGWHRMLPVGAVLLLLVTFSVYQIMVVLFIFGAVALILLQGLSDLLKKEECSAKELLIRMVPYVIVFLIAFIVNTVITASFFQTSDYLGNQIQWGTNGIGENLRLIAGHVVKTLTGYDSIYYNGSFGCLCLLAAVLLSLLLITRKKSWAYIVIMLFYLAALCSTPYLMTIVVGGSPAVRSQLVLPAVTGFLAYLVIELWLELWEMKAIKRSIPAVLLCVVFIGCVKGVWEQTQTTMQLYYTDNMRYEQDVDIARELMVIIGDKYEDEEIAIVVVGNKPFDGNNACVQGETIGTSFFDYDADTQPPCYGSTRRALGLFHVLGADYDIAPMDRFESAIEYSRYMDTWPDKDCVKDLDGVVIIKMSDYLEGGAAE